MIPVKDSVQLESGSSSNMQSGDFNTLVVVC